MGDAMGVRRPGWIPGRAREDTLLDVIAGSTRNPWIPGHARDDKLSATHFFSMFHIGGMEGVTITPDSRSERYAIGVRHCANEM